jgi:hypothetical protein
VNGSLGCLAKGESGWAELPVCYGGKPLNTIFEQASNQGAQGQDMGANIELKPARKIQVFLHEIMGLKISHTPE